MSVLIYGWLSHFLLIGCWGYHIMLFKPNKKDKLTSHRSVAEASHITNKLSLPKVERIKAKKSINQIKKWKYKYDLFLVLPCTTSPSQSTAPDMFLFLSFRITDSVIRIYFSLCRWMWILIDGPSHHYNVQAPRSGMSTTCRTRSRQEKITTSITKTQPIPDTIR